MLQYPEQLVKAPSHYNELAQRTYGKYWGNLGIPWYIYAEFRSDIVLKSLFFVFYKFVFVVVRSVSRDFSTRDNDNSREIRERSRSSTPYAVIRYNSFERRSEIVVIRFVSSRKLMFAPFGENCYACTKFLDV